MTLWTPLFSFACVAFAFALGSFVAFKTKAYISSIIVACAVFIIGYLTGIIPVNTIEVSGLSGMVGTFVVAFCIVDIGSKLRFSELKREWRTVLANLGGTLGVVLGCVVFGIVIFGKEYALAAIPPLSGALVATTIVQQQAVEMGAPNIAVFTSIVLVFQFFCGLPLASIMLKKEVKLLKAKGELARFAQKDIGAGDSRKEKAVERKRLIPPMPLSMQSDAAVLFKVALIAAVANALAQLTIIPGSNPVNYIINPNIAYLLLAVVCAEIGFLERSPLDVSCSRGIVYLALLALLPASFASVSGSDIAAQVVPAVGMILFGAAGICGVGALVSKFLGISPWMSIAIGLTCYLGYPGSQIVVEESVRSSDLTGEEAEAANGIMVPRMVIGYFVAGITSVILAGVVAPLIFS